MLVMTTASVLRLTATRPPTFAQRVAYELARERIATTRAPAPGFAHLARGHD